VTAGADVVACASPRSIDLPRSPTSGARRESEGHPQRIRGGHVANPRAHVRWQCWATGAMSALPGPEEAKPAAMPRDHRLRLDDVNHPACESHAHRIRSAAVKRRRGRRDRRTTASWCRSARISRCSEARDSTRNRSEWSSETTTDHMPAGYRRVLAISIDATRSNFSVVTTNDVRLRSSTGTNYAQRR
jgi:hypothetical protein